MPVKRARVHFQPHSYQIAVVSCIRVTGLDTAARQADAFARCQVDSPLPDGLRSVILTRNASFPMCDQGKS